MPANFPMTQSMIKSALKAGRMKGEMMWLTSQSPEDAINCAIFAALVQQTATKILLPNPDAKWEGYKEIGLTEKSLKTQRADEGVKDHAHQAIWLFCFRQNGFVWIR